jgi:hypothetical protein
LRRWLLVLCLTSAAVMTACGSGSGCPDSVPLDCRNGACCDTSHVFQCDSRCWITPSAAADNACTAFVLCKSGEDTVCYADWNCAGQPPCIAAMGGDRGVSPAFSSQAQCESWQKTVSATSKCYCG